MTADTALAEALFALRPLAYPESWPNDDPDDIGPSPSEDAAAIIAALAERDYVIAPEGEVTEAVATVIHRWRHPTYRLGECKCRSEAEWAVTLPRLREGSGS